MRGMPHPHQHPEELELPQIYLEEAVPWLCDAAGEVAGLVNITERIQQGLPTTATTPQKHSGAMHSTAEQLATRIAGPKGTCGEAVSPAASKLIQPAATCGRHPLQLRSSISPTSPPSHSAQRTRQVSRSPAAQTQPIELATMIPNIYHAHTNARPCQQIF
jgi:hypothetical protein